MRKFGLPLLIRLLLFIIISSQTTPTCKSHDSNLQLGDRLSIDSGDEVAKLPINDLIESLLRQIRGQGGGSNVVVHINNLYCVTGAQDVQINPSKHQLINIARGDQHLNPECQRELNKRSLPRKCAGSECKVMKMLDNFGIADEGNGSQEQLRMVSNEPRIEPTLKPIAKGVFSQPVQLLTKPSIVNERQDQDSFRLEVPSLNIYIDGKPLPDKVKPNTQSREESPSKLFKEEMRDLLLEGNYGKTVSEKMPICDRKEEPPCNHDSMTLHGGLELSYEEFRKIIDDVTENPDVVKCIVPGGITGPLSGYFQKVDERQHEHALVHGVCLLDSGLLVPLRAMLRILNLHAWLCGMVPNFSDEGVRKLHSSIKWAQTDNIVEMLRCFVKANKINVVLPGARRVPFAQFEQEEEHIPEELRNLAKVEILGLLIPFTNFRDKLVALCKYNSK